MLKRFTPILTLVALCWLVFVADQLLCKGQLDQHGIIPRRVASLPGILWAPLLHASFGHLAANTLPLLVLGGILCARSQGEFAAVTLIGTLLSGGLTWLFARHASHVGASGLIFCFFGYLVSLAWFRRTFGTLALAVLCLLGYGGMLKGLLPTATAISWESHLAGLVSGIVLAWAASRLNPPRKAPETKPEPAAGTVQR